MQQTSLRLGLHSHHLPQPERLFGGQRGEVQNQSITLSGKGASSVPSEWFTTRVRVSTFFIAAEVPYRIARCWNGRMMELLVWWMQNLQPAEACKASRIGRQWTWWRGAPNRSSAFQLKEISNKGSPPAGAVELRIQGSGTSGSLCCWASCRQQTRRQTLPFQSGSGVRVSEPTFVR